MNFDASRLHRFCEFFSTQITAINSGDFSRSPNVYKRLLLCCVLDALAKTAFPQEQKNAKRFTRLINDYAIWPDCHKVSLSHLRKLLSHPEAKNPVFANVKAQVDSMPAQQDHDRVSLKGDPDFSNIDKIWPRKNGKPVKIKRKLWAESVRHDYLFYGFRNNLVHEFNAEEITGFEPSAEPYYMCGRLYHPTEFILLCAQNVVKNFEKYLEANKLDPYKSFVYGPYLIPELNP